MKKKILIEKEILEELLLTNTKKQIADKYGCSPSVIYRLVKLYDLQVKGEVKKICIFCNSEYMSTLKHGTHLRQKYCSDKCRESHWVELNPELHKQHMKKWRLKTPVECKFCGMSIPKDKRKSGLVLCSEECRKKQKTKQMKKYRKIASNAFVLYKESKGCSICGYAKYGGSLDFHHVNVKDKIRRISAMGWYFKSKKTIKELKKCILVCKNCHYELHRNYNDESSKKLTENGDV